MAFILGEFLRSQPSVPKLPPLDFNQIQADTLSGNLGNLPTMEELASKTNQFNQSEWLKQMNLAFPNFDELKNSVSSNILSMSKGQIPTDVSEAVQRSAAVRALGGGFSGSGMQGALTARDLGTTSLNLMQQGQNAFERWNASLNLPKTFDVSSMMFTPQQKTEYAFRNREDTFQRDYLKSQISAQYSAGSRLASTEDSFMKML